MDFQLSDAEKKGVRYGSIINAILGTVVTGSPAAGIAGGTMTYNAGTDNIMGEKKADLEAQRYDELIKSSIASRENEAKRLQMEAQKPWWTGQVGADNGQEQTATIGPGGMQTYGKPTPKWNPNAYGGSGQATSLQKNMQYLQDVGLAKNPQEAYNLARQSQTMSKENFMMNVYRTLNNPLAPLDQNELQKKMQGVEDYYDTQIAGNEVRYVNGQRYIKVNGEWYQ